jgi:hypothetical protein
MKKILSESKMKEKIPLNPKKKSGEYAVFEKGQVTELSDDDFTYLNDEKNSMLPFLLKEGTFKLVAGDEAPAEPKKSKKQQKKEAAMAKKVEEKKAVETANERQGK